MKINQFLIPIDAKNEWNFFVKQVPHSIYHTWEYCNAIHSLYNKSIKLYVANTQKSFMICPISIREKEEDYPELYSPYGFGGILFKGNLNEGIYFQRAWDSFWKAKEFVTGYIMQHPLFPLSTEMWEDLSICHNTYLIDLSLPLDFIWRNISKGHKYEIKKSLQERIEVKITKKMSQYFLDDLKKLYLNSMKRVNASPLYLLLGNIISELIEIPNAILLCIIKNKKIEAAALYLYTSWVGEYFFFASTKEGRMYSKLLIWEAIKFLKAQKVSWLNLGGGIRPGDSLEKFKKRFGGHIFNCQVLKQIFNKKKYDYLLSKYCSKETNFFPPYWNTSIKNRA